MKRKREQYKNPKQVSQAGSRDNNANSLPPRKRRKINRTQFSIQARVILRKQLDDHPSLLVLFKLEPNFSPSDLDRPLNANYQWVMRKIAPPCSGNETRFSDLTEDEWIEKYCEWRLSENTEAKARKLAKPEFEKLLRKTLENLLDKSTSLLGLLNLEPNHSPNDLDRPLTTIFRWGRLRMNEAPFFFKKNQYDSLPEIEWIKKYCEWRLGIETKKRAKPIFRKLIRGTLRKLLNQDPSLLGLLKLEPNFSPEDLDRPLYSIYIWAMSRNNKALYSLKENQFGKLPEIEWIKIYCELKLSKNPEARLEKPPQRRKPKQRAKHTSPQFESAVVSDSSLLSGPSYRSNQQQFFQHTIATTKQPQKRYWLNEPYRFLTSELDIMPKKTSPEEQPSGNIDDFPFFDTDSNSGNLEWDRLEPPGYNPGTFSSFSSDDNSGNLGLSHLDDSLSFDTNDVDSILGLRLDSLL